jgi:Nif-specific regulatory protein
MVVAGRVSHDLKCLIEGARVVSTFRSVQTVSQAILELIGTAIAASHAAMLLDAIGPDEWRHRFHWTREVRQTVRVPRTILRRVFKEKVSILSNDVLRSDSVAESIFAAQASSILAVPILAFDHVAGILYLDSSDPATTFTRDDLELLTGFAAVIAGSVDHLLRVHELQTENEALRAQIAGDRNLVGRSPAMETVYRFIAKVAPSEATVLIGGESGTGKELVARAVHQNSRRSQKPFIAINCAAITETLLESELFGHEKGAFTGAIAQKKGKIEEAAGGTLFLDEVGELVPALQGKLLRVLQEREFDRVGGTRTVKADVRVIAATNRNLKEAVEKGTFRQDLFYRLNVVSIVLPSLTERMEDLPALVEHFIAKHSIQVARKVWGCSPEAMQCLRSHDWPGNVRELENAIERAVVLGSTEMLLPEDLPETVLDSGPPAEAGGSTRFHDRLRDMKRQLVVSALQDSQYSYADAAKLLGLHPNNLHRLMRNLGIKPVGRK